MCGKKGTAEAAAHMSGAIGGLSSVSVKASSWTTVACSRALATAAAKNPRDGMRRETRDPAVTTENWMLPDAVILAGTSM